MNALLNTSLTGNDMLFLLKGAAGTLALTAIAVIAGSLIGVVLGVVRAERGWLLDRVLGGLCDVLRSVPLLIQLILFNSFVSLIGFPLSAFASGAIVLSLYMAVNCAELVKAGIASVPRMTRWASRSLGMTYACDLRYIVLPIGLRTVFPSWVGLSLAIMKDSALVSVLGFFELLKSSQTLITRTQEPLLLLLIVGAFYFALSFPIARLAARFERSTLR